jgi:hypothetical protein
MEGQKTSILSIVLIVLGLLSLIGGAVLCMASWPRDPGAGLEWTAIAYVAALTWVIAGAGACFFCCVLAAIVQWILDIRGMLSAMYCKAGEH